MKCRPLLKKEISKLEGYINYSFKYMTKIKSGKEPNLEFLGKIGEYFPEPAGLVLRRVPLNDPHGLFNYYKKSAEKFSKILERGKITDKQALEFRLVEEAPFEIKIDSNHPPDYYF